MSRQGANRYPFHNFSLWKPRNERNYASNKKSGLKGKRSAAPLKRPTVMKEIRWAAMRAIFMFQLEV